jgi:hypothetical protein
VERDVRAPGDDGVAGRLERGDQVDALAGLRVDAGPDRPVGEEDGGLVVLEHGGERPDGRLVARDDGDQALHVVRREVGVDGVVRDLAADQREAHAVGTVQLARRTRRS